MSDFLLKLRRLLKVQNNRITSDVMFLVQEEVIDYGYEEGYADEFCYVNQNDCEDIVMKGDKKFSYLNKQYFESYGGIGQKYRRIGLKRRYEFVQVFLTEQGAKLYIKRNRHNLKRPRIYGGSGYRNLEWQGIRKFILEYKK